LQAFIDIFLIVGSVDAEDAVKMRPDQERVRALLIDTISVLCRNGLHFDHDLSVQGLLGITLDGGKDLFIVHIDENIAASASLVNIRSESSAENSGVPSVVSDKRSADEQRKIRRLSSDRPDSSTKRLTLDDNQVIVKLHTSTSENRLRENVTPPERPQVELEQPVDTRPDLSSNDCRVQVFTNTAAPVSATKERGPSNDTIAAEPPTDVPERASELIEIKSESEDDDDVVFDPSWNVANKNAMAEHSRKRLKSVNQFSAPQPSRPRITISRLGMPPSTSNSCEKMLPSAAAVTDETRSTDLIIDSSYSMKVEESFLPDRLHSDSQFVKDPQFEVDTRLMTDNFGSEMDAGGIVWNHTSVASVTTPHGLVGI
jgi:hypothetical protein